MAKTTVNDVKKRRRHLVDQVASSPYFSKSARLREMFVYVCDRVLDHEVEEIHEQEVGRRVFGRPPDYDTSADNTVRVHASMMRKRVDQYFANEGLSEPVVIEIPRGNYAPVFHERPVELATFEPPSPGRDATLTDPAASDRKRNWQVWLLIALVALFAAVSILLFVQLRRLQKPTLLATKPTVQQFWSQVFQSNRPTDLVLGDAALAFFKERTSTTVGLSEYFDRSYLNSAGDRATIAKLDPELGKVLLLKRQANFSDVGLLAPLMDMAHAAQTDTKVRFARDYSFREIRADNAILLGNIGSNPWVEPFENRQTLHWKFDADRGNYYPVDSTSAANDQEKYHTATQQGQPAEGYVTVSLFPNLGGTGTVLVLSGTGGSAMNGALSFLSDEHLMGHLRAQLNAEANAPFPSFELLLKIESRNALPRDSSVLIARRLHP